jgi:hypothetical protein
MWQRKQTKMTTNTDTQLADLIDGLFPSLKNIRYKVYQVFPDGYRRLYRSYSNRSYAFQVADAIKTDWIDTDVVSDTTNFTLRGK